MKPRRPYLALFPVTESRLQFEPEVTVEMYPGLHEVIRAMTGAPILKAWKDHERPTLTDRCRDPERGINPLRQCCRDPNPNDFYHKQGRDQFEVRGVRGNMTDATLVRVTHTTIVLKMDPVWVFLPRMDRTFHGTYEFDRLTGESIQGHRIPDMYLSRIEAFYAGRI